MIDRLLQELDEERQRRGLSKAELARMMGTHPAAARRLLTKHDQNPQLGTLLAAAEVLGLEVRLGEKSAHRVQVREEPAPHKAVQDLTQLAGSGFGTVLADPPWRFTNRTGKVAPEHRRLSRYDTMTTDEVASLPVRDVVSDRSHLYLWVPNALLADGLHVMSAWGFTYKSNIVWAKRRKDGGPDGRGVGFYFRNVTELLLFGVRGQMRTNAPARSQVNMIETRKREHSRKPDEQYALIEACSPGPYLEMFARYSWERWTSWGAEASDTIQPRGRTYAAYS